MSRAYFPLRSSVELFADPTSPEPVARAKHAAILYDEIAFEIGMFEASITEQGSMTNYRPPNMITEEDRRHARRVIAEGEGAAAAGAFYGRRRAQRASARGENPATQAAGPGIERGLASRV